MRPSNANPQTITTSAGPVEAIDAGSGEPLLVVHGAPGGCDQGWLLANFLLEAGFRVVAPSRPGYLGTPLGEFNAAIDGQADLHAALLDALDIPMASVISWSGGGPSAFRLAVRHPERVRRLVALAAVSEPYKWVQHASDRFILNTKVGNWLLHFMAEHRPKPLISSTLSAEGELDRRTLHKLSEEVFADPVKRQFVLDLDATLSHRGERQEGIENDARTFAEINDLELSRITAPTLLVQGEVDTDVPPMHSDHALLNIPGARLLTIPEGTHLAVFTAHDSERIQGDIVAFLHGEDVPAARGALMTEAGPSS